LIGKAIGVWGLGIGDWAQSPSPTIIKDKVTNVKL
jgi:hypothetical protein